MKKIMCAIGAAALCGAVFAEGETTEGIPSANTVGYITVNVAKGQNRTFSLNLTDCGKPTDPVRIDKLFAISKITNVTGWGTTMDQIWRWDTKVNQWAKYGYQKPRSGGTAAWRKYLYLEASPSFVELTDDDVVQPGETFLYYRGGTDTAILTISGQVKEFGSESSYMIAKGHNQFISYPWPIDIKISDIPNLATFSKITNVTGWGTTMDQIWRWDTKVNQWAKYGYQKPRSGGTAAWRKYLYLEGTPSFADLTDDDKIAAGEGFLYYRGGTDTLTLTWNPLETKAE